MPAPGGVPRGGAPRGGEAVIVIHNPTAGAARSGRLAAVLRHLEQLGAIVERAATEHPGHAEAIARAVAARGGAPLVVAAGGDGTIAEVVNGLVGGDACLGIIPIGTANVLARELCLPTDPAALVAMLVAGHTIPLWPGVIARMGQAPRCFVQMLGVGFDAHVVNTLSLPLKRRLGRAAYVVQAVRALATYRFPRLELEIDGVATATYGAIVSKGRFYGGGYLLAPDARVTAPDFSITLLDHPGPGATLRSGVALGRGTLARLPGIRRMRAHRVDFLNPDGVAAQADGDPAGTTPFSLRNAEKPLAVLVPTI